MFKLGFLKSGGAIIPDVIPNPVNFDSLYADNFQALSSGTYQYIAQQITGINVPITLSLKSELDPTYGYVYYQVANSWPFGTFTTNDGPIHGPYGTFNQAPGAIAGTPFNNLTPVTFTVNPNQWLILVVNGIVPVISGYNFSGELRNVSDGTTQLSGLANSYYNLQTNIANPITISTGPTYDYTNNPSEWFYSTAGLISGIIPTATTIDLAITYTQDVLFDSMAVLYYKKTTTPPSEAESWSTSDPVTLGYTALSGTGDKILNVKTGDYITFAIGTGGRTVQGTINTTIEIFNDSHFNELLSSFNGFADTP
jgi:hypothetical protein